jgi:hypothetical protein
VPRLLHHFEQQEIRAGLGERLGELAIRGALRALVGIRVRVEARRQARDRSGDRDLAAAFVARFARGGDGARVDGRKVVAATGGFEHESRRGKRARRDDVGAAAM